MLTKLIKLKWIQIGLGILCTVLVLIGDDFDIPIIKSFLTRLDYSIYDQIIALNWRQHKQDPKVFIIDIDDKSIQKEGRWPWRRDKIADLITKLKQAGVVTIGIDIVMSEAEINYALGLKNRLQELLPNPTAGQKQFFTTLETIAPQVDNDQALANSLLDHNVVLGFLLHNDSTVKKGKLPNPLTDSTGKNLDIHELPLFKFQGYNASLDTLINSSTKGGFVSNIPDLDGSVRKGLLLASYNGEIHPSLALEIAMNYLLVDHLSLKTVDQRLIGIQLDGTFIPTNSHAQLLIPYWGGFGTLDYYSATDILQNKFNPKELQGSVAIIGSTITLLADLHKSPVGLLFPGAEMTGNIVQGIIAQQIIEPYDWHSLQGRVIFIVLGLFFACLIPFLEVNLALLLTLSTIFLALAGSVYLFVYHNFYIPLGALISLFALQAIINYSYSFILEKRQKREISRLFGQYVPPDYLKELIEYPEHFSMEGQTRIMTVLFADIRSFTSISETLDATGVKRLLNTFFTPITELIFKNRGTIDKYVGDMIVAFWGAPIADEHHAKQAIITALSIFSNLNEINTNMISHNLPAVNIGVGLATGPMNVGDMGSEFRRAYTVLGDTVNLASRLQDLTKFYQVNILVNDTTREGQDDIVWQAVDKVAVKGRKTALIIYHPLCMLTEASSELLAELEEYKIALENYYKQNWAAAELRFTTLKQAHPKVYLYQMYLKRTKAFKKNPPSADWEGVHVHTHK